MTSDPGSVRDTLDFIRTIATVAMPVVMAVAAYRFQRRQKHFEAVMNEKVRHYGVISPLLNAIFSYRQRVGDFLRTSPEAVLEAKRKADHEFWTFEYLWSTEFRGAYHEFIGASFVMWGAEGTPARIRAEGKLYALKAQPGGPEFTDEPVDRKALGALYNRLKAAIARDLGFLEFAAGVETAPPSAPR